jgi:flagellar protein FlaG
MLDRITSPSNPSQQVKLPTTSEGNNSFQVSTLTNEEINSSLNENEKEKVSKLVDSLNDFLTPTRTSLKFEYHEKLNEYYVTLVDDNTKEIVKEIPSKKMLDFYAAMKDFIGIMIDKKI